MKRRGSTLVESSVVLLLFLTILIGVLDFGQVLFFHHFLMDRVRAGARYAAVTNPDAATVRNYVAYNNAAPAPGTNTLFGLDPAMVVVKRQDAGTASDRIEVSISTYRVRFLSPWLAGSFQPSFTAVMPMESAGGQ
jgi:hypothetical protein